VLHSCCRAFEQELLDAAGVSDEKQLERLRGLWQRQLQLPQSAAAELLAEYEAWEASSGKVSLGLLLHADAAAWQTRFE
jgi:hypothetical protein